MDVSLICQLCSKRDSYVKNEEGNLYAEAKRLHPAVGHFWLHTRRNLCPLYHKISPALPPLFYNVSSFSELSAELFTVLPQLSLGTLGRSWRVLVPAPYPEL